MMEFSQSIVYLDCVLQKKSCINSYIIAIQMKEMVQIRSGISSYVIECVGSPSPDDGSWFSSVLERLQIERNA